MIIYKDVISNDEMISDAFEMALVDDVLYEVDCKLITVNHGANIDIGANASTEEAGEKLEDGQEVVNNILHSFGLVETVFDRDSYKTYIRGYLKSIKKYLENSGAPLEEIKTFEAGAKRLLTTKLGSEMFKDNAGWRFYIGESMNVDGMVVLHNFKGGEDDLAGYLVFWKHGLKGEKV